MAERPVIFAAESVRAILAGRKTQTRRVFKRAMEGGGSAASVHPDGAGSGWICWWPDPVSAKETARLYPGAEGIRCPYGVVGDRLWVRETFFEVYDRDTVKPTGRFCYLATHDGEVLQMDEDGRIKVTKGGWKASPWKSPIFMPRVASRLTLEVTEVRVERVQDITHEDAITEGVTHRSFVRDGFWNGGWAYDWGRVGTLSRYAGGINPRGQEQALTESDVCLGSARMAYAREWDSLNAKRGFSWESNPWVFVLTFRRCG